MSPVESNRIIPNNFAQTEMQRDLSAPIKDRDEVGGINLSDEHLTINIKVDGAGMLLPANMQDPAMVNIQGLSPIIREIGSVTPQNLPAFCLSVDTA